MQSLCLKNSWKSHGITLAWKSGDPVYTVDGNENVKAMVHDSKWMGFNGSVDVTKSGHP